MHYARPLVAAHPMQFGRGRSWLLEAISAPGSAAGDLKLFAATFAAGFLFVSILIG